MLNKGNVSLLIVFLILSLGILGGVFYLRFGRTTNPQKPTTNGVTPTPTPIPLHPGSANFKVSQSKHEGPTFVNLKVNPLDVKKGQEYTITVTLKNSAPIQNVTGTIHMDNSTADFDLTKSTSSDQGEEWQAKITMSDSVFYTYLLTISATSTNGISTIRTPLR